MRYLLAVTLLVTALVPSVALAQDGPGCTDEELGNIVSILEGMTAEIRALQDAGDTDAALQTLTSLHFGLSAAISLCNPLSWEGSDDSLIGPVELPGGHYRATVTTDGFFIAELTALDGECDDGSFIGLPVIFTLFDGEASDGAEALVVSEGCSALLEISNTSAPWTLTLERMG